MDTVIQEQIVLCCKTLKLNQAIAQTCFEIEGSNNQEYLLNVLRLEIEGREQPRRNRLLKGAGFYSMKTFEGYSFEGIRIPDSINVDDIKEGRFIEKKENLILYGNVRQNPYGNSYGDKRLWQGLQGWFLQDCSLGKSIEREEERRNAWEFNEEIDGP